MRAQLTIYRLFTTLIRLLIHKKGAGIPYQRINLKQHLTLSMHQRGAAVASLAGIWTVFTTWTKNKPVPSPAVTRSDPYHCNNSRGLIC